MHLNASFSIGAVHTLLLNANLHFTRQGDVDTCWIYPVIVECEKGATIAGDVDVDTISVEDALEDAITGNFKPRRYFDPFSLIKSVPITATADEQGYIERSLNITKWFNKAQKAQNLEGDDAHEFYLILVVFCEQMAATADVYVSNQMTMTYLKMETELF
jgi:hypothetical protein